ncbi:MAG: hypothetical protein EA421_14290 [Gemmatimonadales bacterium]|nr:MAG: hypothetical protein EA421_14290 [Gemmatimonadales bacterium]
MAPAPGRCRRNLSLLLPIATGMLLGAFAMASLVEFLLERRPELVRSSSPGSSSEPGSSLRRE